MSQPLIDLLREARRTIAHAAWAGGQSKGYYCRHCHDWRNNAKMPKTSSDDIVHAPGCILSRIDAVIASNPTDHQAPASGALVHPVVGRLIRPERQRELVGLSVVVSVDDSEEYIAAIRQKIISGRQHQRGRLQRLLLNANPRREGHEQSSALPVLRQRQSILRESRRGRRLVCPMQ